MTDQASHYLRYPNLHGDLITFVAEDDVWLAPLAGGRAWRVSSMGLPAKNPRFSPDGKRLLWTVLQGSAPELVSADVDGGDFRRLTWFGHASTKLRGFTPQGDALVASAFEQPEARHTFAYALSPVDGSRTALPFGPIDSAAFGPVVGDEKPVVVSSVYSREPAWWKRYRGGTAGKLWLDRDGSGEFVRLLPEVDGNLVDPMWIGDRIAFLSDHEGYGNLYSVEPKGGKLKRHTDHQGFYVRHASTDGQRVVFESAGNLFLLDGLDAEPVQLDLSLGSAATGRRKHQLDAAEHLGDVRPNHDGTASLIETHGTVHLLTHKDGPARGIESTAGVRARLPRPLGDLSAIYVADHDGEEAVCIAPLDNIFIFPIFPIFPAFPTSPAFPSRSGLPPTGALPSGSGPAAVPQAGAPMSPPETVSGENLPSPVSAASVNHPGQALRIGTTAATESDNTESDNTESDNTESDNTDQPHAAQQQPVAAQFVKAGQPTVVRRLAYPSVTRAAALETSPDGKYAAIGTEYGQVLLVDAAENSIREISASKVARVEELVFSPDSQWLLWREFTGAESERSKLRLLALSSGEISDLTDGRFADFSASFTPDGKYVAFLSRRSFDPVYDTHNFDLAFPQGVKPFLIALSAKTASPFGPAVAGIQASGIQASNESSDASEDAAGTTAAETTSAGTTMAAPGPEVLIDLEGLADRIIAVPVAQGNYRNLRATRNALLWLDKDLEGVIGDGRANDSQEDSSPHLDRFDFGTKETSTLVEEADSFELSGDGNRLVLRSKDKVKVLPSDKKVEEKSVENTTVDLGRIRVLLDPVKVWGQAFDEAWRLQRDFFWTEGLAGIDWEGVHRSYRPIVDRLGSHDDLVDLLWEMHGELGTSHAYVRPEPVNEPGAGAQGRLGAEIVHQDEGWVVERILPGESSEPLARSPLSAPGVAVRAGDLLLAVDGVPLAEGGPAPLLAGSAGKIVELTMRNGPLHGEAAGQQRRVAVLPLDDEERLRYQDWVRRNRDLVRQASDGRFGYVHVPDMMARGWAQLHRDLETEFGKDALIVDVRRNRGGHTSQLVAELIGRKITAWSRARAVGDSTYPAFSPRGPVLILTDEFAGSDGDIITQVAKLRGIGPVVGTRTWGGVVGIDNRFKLADGTGVTQPRYAFWFTGGVGWSVENYGVDPDIEVPFPPHAYAAGQDPQLEYGLGALREMLDEIPAEQPPAHTGYRQLQPGALPPRPQTAVQ